MHSTAQMQLFLSFSLPIGSLSLSLFHSPGSTTDQKRMWYERQENFNSQRNRINLSSTAYETNKINGKTHLNLDSIRISTLELQHSDIAYWPTLKIASFSSIFYYYWCCCCCCCWLAAEIHLTGWIVNRFGRHWMECKTYLLAIEVIVPSFSFCSFWFLCI